MTEFPSTFDGTPVDTDARTESAEHIIEAQRARIHELEAQVATHAEERTTAQAILDDFQEHLARLKKDLEEQYDPLTHRFTDLYDLSQRSPADIVTHMMHKDPAEAAGYLADLDIVLEEMENRLREARRAHSQLRLAERMVNSHA